LLDKNANNKVRSNRIVASILLLSLIFLTSVLQAQCRSFAKRKCLPYLENDDFAFSGQLNNAVVLEGDKLDISLTFHEGKTYRLMVCSQPILGPVSFVLLDKNRTQLFNSKEADVNYFDFKVESTQQFILEIVVPEAETTHGIHHEGCVCVLQGYK
jgi:hypothetical protein